MKTHYLLTTSLVTACLFAIAPASAKSDAARQHERALTAQSDPSADEMAALMAHPVPQHQAWRFIPNADHKLCL